MTEEKNASLVIPLHATTWDIDIDEGQTINDMKASHLDPYTKDSIQVAPDFERNVLVTSVDALLNWSRKSSVFPMTFGLACCAFEMIASAMSRFDISRFGMEAMRASPRQARGAGRHYARPGTGSWARTTLHPGSISWLAALLEKLAGWIRDAWCP